MAPASEQPAMSVDCVVLQFTSDTDNIIVTLTSSWLAVAQSFAEIYFLHMSPHKCTIAPICIVCFLGLRRRKSTDFGSFQGLGTITLCPNLKGVALSKVLNGLFVFFPLLNLFLKYAHPSALKLSCVWSNPISSQCLFQGAWFREDGNFNLPSIIFPIITPFTAISLHPESRERAKQLKRRASCTRCLTLIWISQKRKGGVYTLLGVYYRAAITFCLFSPCSLHSLTLLTGSGGPPWWLDSITCDSFDLMSLFGSLYLFEQLRGNCVTLSEEDVLWQRTRWTKGTSRGSVAIINEGYFPQHSQTLCMCTLVWMCCRVTRVRVCVFYGGGGVMSPSALREFNCEMHIQVACAHFYLHFFSWYEQNCFHLCFFYLKY